MLCRENGWPGSKFKEDSHTNESNSYQLPLSSSSKKEYNYTLLKLPVIQVAV